jgi:hypothetical protein
MYIYIYICIYIYVDPRTQVFQNVLKENVHFVRNCSILFQSVGV